MRDFQQGDRSPTDHDPSTSTGMTWWQFHPPEVKITLKPKNNPKNRHLALILKGMFKGYFKEPQK